MVGASWSKRIFFLVLTASTAIAVDPSPEDRKYWDDRCKAKLGSQYYMVFDSNGKPTTTCKAPPYQGCYWGPYTDPKTGQPGCCGKGNGQFFTDPIATQEGGCCRDPERYSFDVNANRGLCCANGSHATWDLSVQPLTQSSICCGLGDAASVDRTTRQTHCCPLGLSYVSDPVTLQGGCCEPTQIFSVDAATRKGNCCEASKVYKVDPLTGAGSCCDGNAEYKCDCKCTPPADINPKCPDDHLKIIQNGGKKWKIFCELINHGSNDISTTPNIATWGQCINNCAQIPHCVRAIYNPSTRTCYLRSHGNKPDAITAGPYSSAHLVEDDPEIPDPTTPDSGTTDQTTPEPNPEPTDIGDPKHCPQVAGRIVDVGGVTYEIQCTHGISDKVPDYKAVTAADIGECMNFCTADPACQGVNFYDDGDSDGCVMVQEHEYPAAGNVDPSSKLISAVPIKKR